MSSTSVRRCVIDYISIEICSFLFRDAILLLFQKKRRCVGEAYIYIYIFQTLSGCLCLEDNVFSIDWTKIMENMKNKVDSSDSCFHHHHWVSCHD
jgi:hypothetical protein